MKKFNKDKYLKKLKLKRFWQNNSRYFYIGVPCILCGILGIYFAYSKFFVTQEDAVVQTSVGNFVYGDVIINNYVNGQYTVEAPARGTGYKVDKIACNNGAVGEWSGKDWGPTITNVTRRSKCNIYFVDVKKINIGNVTVPLDDYGLCPTVNADGTVSVTEAEKQYGYLCKAKDAYGDSYYYRGNVTNNYVKFGEWQVRKYFGYDSDTSSYYHIYDSLEECQNASYYNKKCAVGIDIGTPMYWRIIRINGDGTVRVIYDGTSANGGRSEDKQIGTSSFNDFNSNNISPDDDNPIPPVVHLRVNDNAHVGYMYGKTGASTYAETHANTNNSIIKTYLDTWYENNIKGTTNEQYIADNIFCNDRSFAPDNRGTGAGTSSTYYRWGYFEYNANNNKIMLTCPQKNDAFTVNDTNKGNGALSYGIGLITADEVVLASVYRHYGYLYNGVGWTMSPSYFDRYPTVGIVEHSRSLPVTESYGVQPVLNLNNKVLSQGSGTSDDPYHIAEN